VAYSAEQVLLNKPQIYGGPAKLHCYHSLDKLRHTRYVAYSVELVLLNKHQISGGGAYADCYPFDLKFAVNNRYKFDLRHFH